MLTDEPGPPRDDGPDALLGRMVGGKYRVIDLIAQGGMGRIYRAEQVGLGRIVALKVLHPRYHEVDPAFEKRFMQEAATCGQLRCANTVVVYDHGRIEEPGLSTLYMAMEYIEGPTLRRVLARERQLPEARAVAIAVGIARSLREAHALGIVHRDLKPANIMLTTHDEEESVKVVDFGVAKVLRSDLESLTLADRIIGSPRYMAPEQIRHQEIDGRADLYALGVLLFEMLAGKSPFRGEHAVDTLMLHLTGEFPTILSVGGRSVDPELERIVRRCTEKAASERFASATDLLGALRRWQRHHGASGPDGADGSDADSGQHTNPVPRLAVPLGPSPTGSRSGSRFVVSALFALLVLLGIGAAIVLPRFGEPEVLTPAVADVAPAPAPLAPPPALAPAPAVVESPAPPVAPEPAPVAARPRPASVGTLQITSDRRALVFVDGKAIGYAPITWQGPSKAYRVSAMLPGQPDTQQLREVALDAATAEVPVRFEFAPVAPPAPVVAPPPEGVPPVDNKTPGRRGR